MSRASAVVAAAAAAALVASGCGVSGASSGVVAVDTDRLPVVDAVVGTLPPTVPGEPTPAQIEAADVDEVDTIVEPEVRVRPTTVAVVGDSLTLSASDELDRALRAADLDPLVIDAQESRRMTVGTSRIRPGRDVVEEIVAAGDPAPELWVIALGTNDVASVESLEGFRPDIRSILDLLPDDVPVVWVDLYIRNRPEPISRANLQIRAELGGRAGGTAVVDWFSHGVDDGVITDDGVHLTPTGRAQFAESIVAAIDELFPPAEPAGG